MVSTIQSNIIDLTSIQPQRLPLPSNSAENLTEIFVENLEKNLTAPHKSKSWDNLYHCLVKNNVIHSSGEWLKKACPPLPQLGKSQRVRLNSILDTTYQVFHDPGYGEPKSATLTLRELINGLGYTEVELVGSGVGWVLGEEFYRQFLLDLGVGEDLITDELLEVLRKRPQDFDFKFPAEGADAARMDKTTLPLFQLLADKFDLPMGVVCSAHRNKRYSKSANYNDQFGSVTLQLFECESAAGPQEGNIIDLEADSNNQTTKAPPVRAFDVDFIFKRKQTRKHLNKQDAASLKFKLPFDELPELKSDLPEVRVALVQRLLRVLDVDEAQSVNNNGLPRALAATTKGHYALKPRYFSNLFMLLKRQKKLNSIPKRLHKQVAIHCKGHPLSLLAAAFNANTFLGPATAKNVFNTLSPNKFAGDSFLHKICKAIWDGVNTADLHHLLTVHSYLGLGPEISIFQKTQANLIELQSSFGLEAAPISLFLYDRLANSLEKLAAADDWSTLERLSVMLTNTTPSEGFPLPKGILPGTRQLYRVNNIAAKKLAMNLLCRWQRQNPDDLVIETLLSRFIRFCKIASYEDKCQMVEQLIATLDTSPGTCPHEKMSFFTHKLHTLFAQPVTANSDDVIKALNESRHIRLRSVAFKNILEKNPTPAQTQQALAFLKESAQKQPADTLDLFFKHILPLSLPITETFQLFVHLLEENEKKKSLINIHSLQKYIKYSLLENLSQVHNEDLKKAIFLLKKIDPLSATAVINSSLKFNNKAKKDYWDPQEFLNAFKEKVLAEENPLNNQNEFLKYIESPYFSGHEEILQNIFIALFNKLNNYSSAGQAGAQHLLLARATKKLYQNSFETYLNYLDSTLPTTHLNARVPPSFIDCYAETLSCFSPQQAAFEERTQTLQMLLNTAYELRTEFSPSQKTSLQSSLQKIIPLLHEKKLTQQAFTLIYQCKIHQIDITLPPACANEIYDLLVQSIPSAKRLDLTVYEAVYSILKNCLKNENQAPEASAIASAFIKSYISQQTPLPAIRWAKKIGAPHPIAEELLKRLKDCGCIEEQIGLLRYEEGLLFTRETLQAEWLRLIRSYKDCSPETAAEICLNQKVEMSLKNKKTLLKKLINNLEKEKDPPETSLKLLIAYQITDGSLWNKVLSSMAARPSKSRIEQAWQNLKTYYPQAPNQLYCSLLQSFSKFEIYDAGLIEYLDDAKFEASRFIMHDKKVQAEVRQNLFDNALRCIKNGTKNLDFETLDSYRKKHHTTFSNKDWSAAWYAETNAENVVNHLKRLQAQGDLDKNKELQPSIELLNFIEKHIIPTEDPQLQYFCLQLLIQKEYKVILEIHSSFTSVLQNLLLASLNEAHKTKNTPLAVEALNLFSANSQSFIKNLDEKGRVYPTLLKALPLLLNSKYEEKTTFYSDFVDLYKKIVTNFSLGKQRIRKEKNKTPNPLGWADHHAFLGTLMEVNTDDINSLYKVLELATFHYKGLFHLHAGHKAESLAMMDKFVYSTTFSHDITTDVGQTIHTTHYHKICEVINLAKSQKLIQQNELSFLEYDIFLKTNVENPKSYSDAEKEAASLHVIRMLLKNPSPYSLQRATLAITNMLHLVKHNHKEALNNISEVIFQIEKLQLPRDLKLSWLDDALSILPTLLIKNSKAKTPLLDEDTCEKYKQVVPHVFVGYLDKLYRYCSDDPVNNYKICLKTLNVLDQLEQVNKLAAWKFTSHSSIQTLALPIFLSFWKTKGFTFSDVDINNIILNLIEPILNTMEIEPQQAGNLAKCLNEIMRVSEECPNLARRITLFEDVSRLIKNKDIIDPKSLLWINFQGYLNSLNKKQSELSIEEQIMANFTDLL